MSSSSDPFLSPVGLHRSMVDKLADIKLRYAEKRQKELMDWVTTLDPNVGSLFRCGIFTVTPVLYVPDTLNCDVPYLAAYTGDQKLSCTREPLPDMVVDKDHILMQKLVFGLFNGNFPTKLHLRLRDKDNIPDFLEKLGSRSKTFIELNETFDTELPAQEEVTNGMVVEREMSCRGGGILRLTITYTLEEPRCHNTIVTSRFRELLKQARDDPNAAVIDFNDKHPNAKNYRYLMIPGLFTEFYPGYFSKNIKWLSESLGLDVKKSSIKTTVGLDKNADHLAKEIMEMAQETPEKKIIVIGHSKGSVDFAVAVQKHPEILEHIYGHVAMQAPYGGSYMIEWVMNNANEWASAVVTKLWGGEVESYQDLCYAKRLKAHEEWLYDGKALPTVCIASYADFSIDDIDTLAEVGGIVSMKFAADRIKELCGAYSDGLVAQVDSRLPGADCVLVPDLMHSEPAMQWPGTRYPCGPLTHTLLDLLFEKIEREQAAQS